MRTLESSHLILRPLSAVDLIFYCGLYTDTDVMRHIAAPLTADAARRAFDSTLISNHEREDDDSCWVIRYRDDTSPMGVIGWHRHRPQSPRTGEIGAVLSRQAQGRGISIEAGQMLMNHAFGNDLFDAFVTEHAVAHVHAAIMMGRLGFERSAACANTPNMVHWHMTKQRWFDLHRQSGAPTDRQHIHQ